jgi:hypothetical protein
MSHSSTSSSEATLCLAGWRPWGALVALTLLVLFEFLVARQDHLWDAVQMSEVAVLGVLERKAFRAGSKPQVLVFGNSRVRDGLAPRVIEEAAGLPRGAVANLALTSGRAYDALVLWRRNQGHFDQVRLALIGVDWFDFRGDTSEGNRFRRYGSAGDRWRAWRGGASPDVLIGALWRGFDAGRALADLLDASVSGNLRDLPVAPDGRITWRDVEVLEGPATVDPERMLEMHYGGKWNANPSNQRDLLELISILEAEGVVVVLMRIPYRPVYVDAALERYGAQVASAQDLMRIFEDRWWWGSHDQDEMGIPVEWFYDYGHPTTLGARALSWNLGRWLVEQHVFDDQDRDR